MEMLNFDAYSHKDLQHFVQMLNQCESAGVTDIRFIRQRLHAHLYPPQKIRPVRRKKATVRPSCPSCGRGVLVGPYAVDGLMIMRCSVKCGYSEIR